MASTSVSPVSDDPDEAAARRHRDRLARDFTPVPGVHEPYSESSRNCRACSAHFGIGILFPCLSYQAEHRPRRHGEEGENAGAEQC